VMPFDHKSRRHRPTPCAGWTPPRVDIRRHRALRRPTLDDVFFTLTGPRRGGSPREGARRWPHERARLRRGGLPAVSAKAQPASGSRASPTCGSRSRSSR
jgi:hypothetical protein